MTDKNIQQQIEKAFEANLQLQGLNINVSVLQGNAILTGNVDNLCKKDMVRKLAKEVEGVSMVNDQIMIIPNGSEKIKDIDIETEIKEKYKKNFGNAHKEIKIIVKDGYVWLEGRLRWKYQKELADQCIHCIEGINGIENHIWIPEMLEPEVNEKDVLAAIYSDHSITTDIRVEIFGHLVIIKGVVADVNQKNLVTRLVRNVEGVREVENFLSVHWKVILKNPMQ